MGFKGAKFLLPAILLLLFLSLPAPAQAGQCPTPGDYLPCDGWVDMSELTSYINEWYACSACVPDIYQALVAYFTECLTEGDCGTGEVCQDGECITAPTGECLPEENCYYVSVAGDGEHNGSAGNEFTLEEAQGFADLNLDTGLTFLLAGGDYGEFYQENVPNNRMDWVTWKAASGQTPVFDRVYIYNENKKKYLY
jgi:hypothetical protein